MQSYDGLSHNRSLSWKQVSEIRAEFSSGCKISDHGMAIKYKTSKSIIRNIRLYITYANSIKLIAPELRMTNIDMATKEIEIRNRRRVMYG